jgi:uncharacterized membrane protein YfcA
VGFASGLLGVGGGFILVPTLILLMNGNGMESISTKSSLGTSLATIFPIAIFNSYNHYRNSKFDIKLGVMLGCFGLIGGLIGGHLAIKMDSEILQKILAIAFFIISLQMFFKSSEKKENKIISADKNKKKIDLKKILFIVFLGLGIGFLSGIFGVGGGLFIIPVLTFILGFSMVEAVRTSTIFISITSIGGVLPYLLEHANSNDPFLIGYVNIFYVLVILIFSIPTGYIGTKLVYKVNEKILRYGLALVLIYLSLELFNLDLFSLIVNIF